MKTKLSIIIILLGAATLLAATLTITIPANDVPRVTEAFGSVLGLGRSATQQEVQAAVHQWIVNTTHDYERRKNQVQFTPPPLDMQPTPTVTPTSSATPTAGLKKTK